MKAVLIWMLLLACGQSFASPDAQIEAVGQFDNVTSNDEGEHCHGYSLELWKSSFGLLGLLDQHDGLCGDPPCAVLEHVRIDRTTGKLAFSSTILGQRIQFSGSMEPDGIVGVLNGEPVKLLRQAPAGGVFPPDETFPAWCDFWRGVKRCTGVTELCLQQK